MSGVENTGGPPAGINRVEGGAYSQASGTGGNEAQHDLTTTVGRVAENEARAARNVLRVFRREAGEEGVDADEVLLELEGADPSGGENEFLEPITQTSATMSSQSEPLAGVAGTAQAGNITHFEAFMLAMRQEGDLKDKALAYLQSLAPGAKKDAEEKDTGVLKESAAMAAEQRAARRNRIDRRLINLVKLGFHLPLTLCTNEALEIVRQSPARLTCKNQTDFSGAKVSVVDVTVGWPEESSLTSEQWRDAWTNYLTILPEVLEPEGVERFKRHHNFLVRQQNFSTRFPAILRFDIGIRHDYFWGKECVPFFPASYEYVAELAQIQSDISMEHLVGTNSGSGGLNSGRFQPYPSQSDRGGSANKRGGGAGYNTGGGGGAGNNGGGGYRNDGQRSFRRGRSPTSGGPLCLICGQNGHRADGCTRNRLPNNSPAFSTYSNGQLVAVASGNFICMSWNASGKSPCTNYRCPGGSGVHACSFCGSTAHYAGSRRCI